MKSISIIAASISILLLLSTLICGAWIHSHPPVTPDSLAFHMKIGILSVVVSVISFILMLFQILKK